VLITEEIGYDVLNYDGWYMVKCYIDYAFVLKEHNQNMSKNLNSAITAPPAFDSKGRLHLPVGNRFQFFSSVDATTPTTTTTIITITNSVISTSTMITTTTSVITTSIMITTNETTPSAAPTNAGEIVDVCTGGFSMYPNTNITICNKDSLGLTRPASEVTDF
jgi:hypothetical protein